MARAYPEESSYNWPTKLQSNVCRYVVSGLKYLLYDRSMKIQQDTQCSKKQCTQEGVLDLIAGVKVWSEICWSHYTVAKVALYPNESLYTLYTLYPIP